MYDMLTEHTCPCCAPAPFGFGLHPHQARWLRVYQRHLVSNGSDTWPRKCVDEFRDERHPEVICIPKKLNYVVVDRFGDEVARIFFPFSSYDFYVDDEQEGLFAELATESSLWRLRGINQLGYLLPDKPRCQTNKNISYIAPQFGNNRFLHSWLMALKADVILARNGFSAAERAPIVIAMATHDIAMPAGGDSIQRLDPQVFCEERNYASFLEQCGFAARWQDRFNVAQAQQWIQGHGTFGLFVDVLDKLNYTALDCYYLGLQSVGKVRELATAHPLIMDCWLDIRFTPDKQRFYFLDPERVYLGLLLRAYEHSELLFSPRCRCFDSYLTNRARPFYENGMLTKKLLLAYDDFWLEQFLNEHSKDHVSSFLSPDDFGWEKFETSYEAERFRQRLGSEFSHIDHIKPFKTGLYVPVLHEGRIVKLKDALEEEKIEHLESISHSCSGYYVYYKK